MDKRTITVLKIMGIVMAIFPIVIQVLGVGLIISMLRYPKNRRILPSLAQTNFLVHFFSKMALFPIDYGHSGTIFYDNYYRLELIMMPRIIDEKKFRPMLGGKLDTYLVPSTTINSIPAHLVILLLTLIILKISKSKKDKNKNFYLKMTITYFSTTILFSPHILLYGQISVFKEKLVNDFSSKFVAWYICLAAVLLCFYEYYSIYQIAKMGYNSKRTKKEKESNFVFTLYKEFNNHNLSKKQVEQMKFRMISFIKILRFTVPLTSISVAQTKPWLSFWPMWVLNILSSGYLIFFLACKRYLKKKKCLRILNFALEMLLICYFLVVLVTRLNSQIDLSFLMIIIIFSTNATSLAIFFVNLCSKIQKKKTKKSKKNQKINFFSELKNDQELKLRLETEEASLIKQFPRDAGVKISKQF